LTQIDADFFIKWRGNYPEQNLRESAEKITHR